MNPFGRYAQYYDLFYADKNYIGEAQYILSLLRQYRSAAKSVLDLGCGTGKHAEALASNGYTVHGVDYSAQMIAEADQHLQALPRHHAQRLRFTHADIREFRVNRTFDAAISLFHVISYLCSNDDVLRAFATVRQHLHDDGLFIFDCWYGPAVLADRPVARTKYFQDDQHRIKRDANPTLYPNENLVGIDYTFSVSNGSGQVLEQFSETHRMRYFFKPEMEILLSAAGLQMLDCYRWLTKEEPGFDSWYVVFTAKAK
jgi:SAM-dependent methyltransferase